MIVPTLGGADFLAKFAYTVVSAAFGERLARGASTTTYNDPYGAVTMQSALGRSSVSRPGDTPDSYGYGRNPEPTDGRIEGDGGYVDANGDSIPGGFTNAVTGEHGDTLESTPGNPDIVSGLRSWAADIGPRVGTFLLGAVLLVVAFVAITRTPAPTPVTVIAPKGGGKKSGVSTPPAITAS